MDGERAPMKTRCANSLINTACVRPRAIPRLGKRFGSRCTLRRISVEPLRRHRSEDPKHRQALQNHAAEAQREHCVLAYPGGSSPAQGANHVGYQLKSDGRGRRS